jgi:peptidoglycan/xylan/chitin deacetylase (PgdA/CDA1 family)
MRLDRFITLNLVHPFQRAFGEPKQSGGGSVPGRFLPILMYHSISDDPEPGVRPYYRVCTGPQKFRGQMQWLKDNGYQGVTLSAGLAWLNSPRVSRPATPVAITFDDGFRDFYTQAFPILQPHGFLATMYLPAAFIGGERRSFKSRECLTWAEAKELHRAGIEFGSHTVHHPELVDLPWPDIQAEIADSKTQIENQLGAPVKAFAYPYAFPQTRRDFVDRFKDMLMAGGYETCVTTQIGRHRPGADPLQIKRLPVNSGDDDRLFQAKLAGGYDWLAWPQAMIKKIKRRVSGSGKRNDGDTRPARSGEPALGS